MQRYYFTKGATKGILGKYIFYRYIVTLYRLGEEDFNPKLKLQIKFNGPRGWDEYLKQCNKYTDKRMKVLVLLFATHDV